MRQKWNLHRPGLVSGLLLLLAICAYLPAIHLGFVNYDDPLYVTDNGAVQKGLSGSGLTWAFGHFHAANWHPLTWLSHMLDAELWGMRPGGHHLTNILIHAANTALLFLWLHSLTGACWRSALVAALFAVHPLHVESVAWIAERKDVLSTFFGIISLWAYTHYARNSKLAFYLLSLLLFALGLMSKPMLVTWPCVMLLLDYWPLVRGARPAPAGGNRWISLVVEKIPFFTLSAVSSIVTFSAQQAGEAVASLQSLPIDVRIANALTGYVRYLGKLFWPAKLAVIYPSASHVAWAMVAGAALLLVGITWLAIQLRTQRPYLLVGWLWFLGTLVPVIGLVQVGNQSIADRYTYIPAIGLFVTLAWTAGDLAAGSPRVRHALMVTTSAIAIALVIITRLQLIHWQNSETLFRHALAVTKNNFVAWNNLGFFLAGHQELHEAETCYKNAVEINPAFGDAWYNLGCVLADLNRNNEAITALETASRLNPRRVKPHNNLAAVLAAQGRITEAEGHLRTALALDPRSAESRSNLGALLAQEGKWDEAIAQFKQALEFDPALSQAQCGFAGALARRGQFEEAIGQLSALLKRDPTNTTARLQLGGILATQGKNDQAVREYSEAIRSDPRNATAHYRIAALLMREGNAADAISHYQSAIAARSDYAEALNNLAWILATNPNAQYRNGAEAVRLAEQACQITSYQEAFMIGTLAAAYAETGRFSDAISNAQKAEALAKNSNDTELAARTGKLLKLYQASQPYRGVPE